MKSRPRGRLRLLRLSRGLPRFRLYDLRHTYATHLPAKGAPITHVVAQLGHAAETTLDEGSRRAEGLGKEGG